MAQNILIFGGTYFLGKAFCELMLEETDASLVLMHRGNNPEAPRADFIDKYAKSGRVREILADRHDGNALSSIKDERFDAVVDFCAYQKSDIEFIFDKMDAKVDQYIFISTTDVYKRGLGEYLKEDAELETRRFPGAAGDYISGKVALEQEIKDVCNLVGSKYTILRPAFIFGPDNYAPRESMYFHWITNAGQILHPMDADGEFQMVYVKDVAAAIKLVLGNPKAYNEAFNVCENQMENYETFTECLKQSIDVPFEVMETSLGIIDEKGIPLPFPLTKEESNYYDGSKLLELGIKYTDRVTAMRETYQSYMRRNS
jgi:nucleoside-diphosphate-sugar epimerase